MLTLTLKNMFTKTEGIFLPVYDTNTQNTNNFTGNVRLINIFLEMCAIHFNTVGCKNDDLFLYKVIQNIIAGSPSRTLIGRI